MHRYEIEVLRALKKKKLQSMADLQKSTKLGYAPVNYAISELSRKGLIAVKARQETDVQLDEEGREYARKGLPERRALKLIKARDLPISEIQKRLGPKDSQIALVWLRKMNLGMIDSGKVRITPVGKQYLEKALPHEKIILMLSKGKKIPSEQAHIYKELISRGQIVRIKEHEDKEVELKREGLGALKQGPEEEASSLTTEMIVSGKWRGVAFRKYDVNAPAKAVYPGKRHFVKQAEDYARRVWLEMGFKEMTGPLVQTGFWNFDGLFTAQDHPVREMQDTFYVEGKGQLPRQGLVEKVAMAHEDGTNESIGWGYKWDAEEARKLVMRTHTTPLSARTLAALKEDELPAKYFAVGRCFRNEAMDVTHTFEFNQFDGIVVDENANFRHLLGYLKQFFGKIGLKARFRPAYFPYTEMSTEMDIYHPVHKKWVELGGAGMFRPEVVEPLLGKDVPVLAWGPGLDRIMTDYYGINDLRDLYRNDVQQLREMKRWMM